MSRLRTCAFRLLLLAFAGAVPATAVAAPPSVVLDSGDDAHAWTAVASPGATASLRGDASGAVGLSWDLGRGRSHVIARRSLSVDLPADYMLVFRLRAEAEPNTVEFKFISGENVWWRRLVDHEFSRDWKEIRVARSRLEFAWGPAGGGPPVHLDAIEIAVAAGKGGKGELWIDEVRLEPRDPDRALRA
ncbi:MAG: hypothetical protein ABR538_17675, partial [Candidatus Binatia bacterium]